MLFEIMTFSALIVILLISLASLWLAWRAAERPVTLPDSLVSGLASLQTAANGHAGALREEGRLMREEHERQSAAMRTELAARLAEFGAGQKDGQAASLETLKLGMESLANLQKERLDALERQQREALDGVSAQIKILTESNSKSLEQLRADNEAKLEQMRLTVDEKLQGTLEKRLGQSFTQVSEQLEKVHKGLGEMQTLATGVGDLKRVLTNVKARGGWGEVQLGALLEDMLTQDQYEKNCRIRPDSADYVEYAIRLPGPNDDGRVLLPIDAKFPHEDYQRLLDAQDRGAVEEIEIAAKSLERSVRDQAAKICEKYVHPPRSTDFAILYLPTEGLFAEVIRRPGLITELQKRSRVMVMGPTTLGAILNSLQMGFRTLAIQKRSSEVWQVLAAAKDEFMKYGQVWERLEKQLESAKNTAADAGRRTRAVERRLRDVETVAAIDAAPDLLSLPASLEEETS